MKFLKPALTLEQQIELLKRRGLEIGNEAEAIHYLRYIGFYRLSGYALPLTLKNSSGTHDFKPGSTFERILEIYCFDRELRLLVMDAIERIEVAFRTVVSNTMAAKAGPHWFLNVDCFAHEACRQEFTIKVMEETGVSTAATSGKPPRGRDVFIEHYFRNYTDPKLPPTWMVSEVLSISAWSKCFSNLRREDQKKAAAWFRLAPETLTSWMHSICYVRNLCAHHARLWNREFTIRPMIAKEFSAQLADNSRFFAQAFTINELLKSSAPASKWWERIESHIQKHEFVDPAAMGFPVSRHPN